MQVSVVGCEGDTKIVVNVVEFSDRDPKIKSIPRVTSTKVSDRSHVVLQMGAYDRNQRVSLQLRSANPRFPRPRFGLHSISI